MCAFLVVIDGIISWIVYSVKLNDLYVDVMHLENENICVIATDAVGRR